MSVRVVFISPPLLNERALASSWSVGRWWPTLIFFTYRLRCDPINYYPTASFPIDSIRAVAVGRNCVYRAVLWQYHHRTMTGTMTGTMSLFFYFLFTCLLCCGFFGFFHSIWLLTYSCRLENIFNEPPRSPAFLCQGTATVSAQQNTCRRYKPRRIVWQHETKKKKRSGWSEKLWLLSLRPEMSFRCQNE